VFVIVDRDLAGGERHLNILDAGDSPQRKRELYWTAAALHSGDCHGFILHGELHFLGMYCLRAAERLVCTLKYKESTDSIVIRTRACAGPGRQSAFLARYSSRIAGISDLRSRPSCQLTRGLERAAMRFTRPAAPRCPLASSAMKRQFQLRAQSLQQARSTAPTQQTRQLRTPVKARCRRCESVREKAPCRVGRLAGVECSCSPQIPWSAELRGSPVV